MLWDDVTTSQLAMVRVLVKEEVIVDAVHLLSRLQLPQPLCKVSYKGI